jgi:hypothetical protein
MKNTVGDFKRMIEAMNIPDDAIIEGGTTVSCNYSSYGSWGDCDFSVNTYDNGTISQYGDNVSVMTYEGKTTIQIGSI